MCETFRTAWTRHYRVIGELLIMYLKFIGSAIVITITTLLGTEVASDKKKRADSYKNLGAFFSVVQEKLSCGYSDIVKILVECASDYDGTLAALTDELAISIMDSDNKNMKEAFEKTLDRLYEHKNSVEAELLGEFSEQWDLSDRDGCTKIAERLKNKANNTYTELTSNLQNETKLAILSGIFAGVFLVLVLI